MSGTYYAADRLFGVDIPYSILISAYDSFGKQALGHQSVVELSEFFDVRIVI